MVRLRDVYAEVGATCDDVRHSVQIKEYRKVNLCALGMCGRCLMADKV